MSFHGDKFLGGYWHFVRQFIAGYLLLCCAALLTLLVVDAVFPAVRVYDRIAGLIRSILLPTAGPAP